MGIKSVRKKKDNQAKALKKRGGYMLSNSTYTSGKGETIKNQPKSRPVELDPRAGKRRAGYKPPLAGSNAPLKSEYKGGYRGMPKGEGALLEKKGDLVSKNLIAPAKEYPLNKKDAKNISEPKIKNIIPFDQKLYKEFKSIFATARYSLRFGKEKVGILGSLKNAQEKLRSTFSYKLTEKKKINEPSILGNEELVLKKRQTMPVYISSQKLASPELLSSLILAKKGTNNKKYRFYQTYTELIQAIGEQPGLISGYRLAKGKKSIISPEEKQKKYFIKLFWKIFKESQKEAVKYTKTNKKIIKVLLNSDDTGKLLPKESWQKITNSALIRLSHKKKIILIKFQLNAEAQLKISQWQREKKIEKITRKNRLILQALLKNEKAGPLELYLQNTRRGFFDKIGKLGIKDFPISGFFGNLPIKIKRRMINDPIISKNFYHIFYTPLRAVKDFRILVNQFKELLHQRGVNPYCNNKWDKILEKRLGLMLNHMKKLISNQVDREAREEINFQILNLQKNLIFELLDLKVLFNKNFELKKDLKGCVSSPKLPLNTGSMEFFNFRMETKKKDSKKELKREEEEFKKIFNFLPLKIIFEDLLYWEFKKKDQFISAFYKKHHILEEKLGIIYTTIISSIKRKDLQITYKGKNRLNSLYKTLLVKSYASLKRDLIAFITFLDLEKIRRVLYIMDKGGIFSFKTEKLNEIERKAINNAKPPIIQNLENKKINNVNIGQPLPLYIPEGGSKNTTIWGLSAFFYRFDREVNPFFRYEFNSNLKDIIYYKKKEFNDFIEYLEEGKKKKIYSKELGKKIKKFSFLLARKGFRKRMLEFNIKDSELFKSEVRIIEEKKKIKKNGRGFLLSLEKNKRDLTTKEYNKLNVKEVRKGLYKVDKKKSFNEREVLKSTKLIRHLKEKFKGSKAKPIKNNVKAAKNRKVSLNYNKGSINLKDFSLPLLKKGFYPKIPKFPFIPYETMYNKEDHQEIIEGYGQKKTISEIKVGDKNSPKPDFINVFIAKDTEFSYEFREKKADLARYMIDFFLDKQGEGPEVDKYIRHSYQLETLKKYGDSLLLQKFIRENPTSQKKRESLGLFFLGEKGWKVMDKRNKFLNEEKLGVAPGSSTQIKEKNKPWESGKLLKIKVLDNERQVLWEQERKEGSQKALENFYKKANIIWKNVEYIEDEINIWPKLNYRAQIECEKILKRMQVFYGILTIKKKYNNFFITFSDIRGNVISSFSSGKIGLKGSNKTSQIAIKKILSEGGVMAFEAGIRKIFLRYNGSRLSTTGAVKILGSIGLEILLIGDITGIPHGKFRYKKARRL